MKEVYYRGGMLVFGLPESWHEESYPDGGASYYEGNGENGSLHVNLMTASNPVQVTEEMVCEVANTDRDPEDAEAEPLPNGNYLRRFERLQPDGPEDLHFTFWQVANMVPPHTVRLAVFNYSVPATLAGSEAHRECQHMLEEQIRACRFTTLTPEQVAATHPKPWWKFW